MSELERNGTDASGSGIDRRNLLKGAVAAGVGVAAWSAPSITSLGGTPVYAANCTGPVLTYFLGERNTSCDCTTGTVDAVSYKWPWTADCNQPVYASSPSSGQPNPLNPPRTVTFNVDNSGSCPVGTKTKSGQQVGDASVTISAPPLPPAAPGPKYCVIEVIVKQSKNCEGATLASPSTGIISDTGGTVNMPIVACGSDWDSSNIFMSLYLKCSDDDACLTDAY